MSYSFSVIAHNKSLARLKVAEELAKAVISQPSHGHDSHAAQSAANAFIELLPNDETKDVYVTVSGSLGGDERFWATTPDVAGVSSASISVHAYLYERKKS